MILFLIEIILRYEFQSQAVARTVSARNDPDLDVEMPCVWTCQVTPQNETKKRPILFNCQDLMEANSTIDIKNSWGRHLWNHKTHFEKNTQPLSVLLPLDVPDKVKEEVPRYARMRPVRWMGLPDSNSTWFCWAELGWGRWGPKRKHPASSRGFSRFQWIIALDDSWCPRDVPSSGRTALGGPLGGAALWCPRCSKAAGLHGALVWEGWTICRSSTRHRGP